MSWDPSRACPKPQRHKDKKCKDRVRRRSAGHCEWPGCTKQAEGEPHHVQPVGAGGPDIEENQLHLCKICHGECQEYKQGRSKLDQFRVVARIQGRPVHDVILDVERVMGRGIKGVTT